MPNVIQIPAVTRVEVIDARGRVFTQRYSEPGIEIHVQDEGRTVKVFAGTPDPVVETEAPNPAETPFKAKRTDFPLAV